MLSPVKILTMALAAAPLVISAATPGQIVENIRKLTEKSQALQAPAQKISIINGPLILIGQGPFPQIITGFTDIVTTGTIAISLMQGTPPITGEVNPEAIADAFKEFVRVHQVLLNILIGKAGLFQTVPFIGQPVAAVLRQVENVVDTIAFSLIDIVEGQTDELQNQANSLGMTLKTAIGSYDGLALNKRAVPFKS